MTFWIYIIQTGPSEGKLVLKSVPEGNNLKSFSLNISAWIIAVVLHNKIMKKERVIVNIILLHKNVTNLHWALEN